MDEKELKLHARLLAMELMLAEICATLEALPDSHFSVDELNAQLSEWLRAHTFPSQDPVQSDQLSAEVGDAIAILLHSISQRVHGRPPK